MTSILRVKTRWAGFNGGPGYSVMHFRDFGTGEGPGTDPDAAAATAAAGRVRTFFDALKTYVPASATLTVEPEIDLVEDTTGELINSFSITAPAVVQGTGASAFSSANGAVVNWRTNGIRGGRRVRGRTFLVPLVIGAFDTSGGLFGVARTTITTAAAALASPSSTPDLLVYARPTASGVADGRAFAVTSSSVPAMGAILRSRRD